MKMPTSDDEELQRPLEPEELTRQQEVLARLHPSLCAVMKLELRAGNTLEGWDECESLSGPVLVIWLSRPFVGRYEEIVDVRFRVFDDPEYWREDISVRVAEGYQCLVTP